MSVSDVTYLFVPAIKKEIITKAMHSDCDVVLVDLEDAVSIEEKQAARNIVADIQELSPVDKKIIVRINDLTTSFWEDDVEAVLNSGAAGIMLPKTESAEDIHQLTNWAETFSDLRQLEIIPLIETAKGVMMAYNIASSDPAISKIAFGSVDYCLDVGGEQSESGHELLYARSQLVIASRAAGIGSPIDSVYVDLQDEEGLISEVKRAKQIGLTAKLLIHPKQIAPVESILKASAAQIEEAKQIIQVFESALKDGKASVSHQGKMVDYPVYKKALQLIENK